MKKNPIFCALDTTDPLFAKQISESLAQWVYGIKLGLEFFTANGPEGIKNLTGSGLKLFLDLKLHDIPNTVAGAIKSIVPLGAEMTTIHAQGGSEMMYAAHQTAQDTAAKIGIQAPKILAVTVLTSLTSEDLGAQAIESSPLDQVLRLADLAEKAGLEGIICSAHEVKALRQRHDKDFLLVVPGIRPQWSQSNDQKRVMTPLEAMKAGASYLVIGRPITATRNPEDSAQKIWKELSG
jgi:orotidine-5'-phosphate decarboxylase